jgi:hypothetical protein
MFDTMHNFRDYTRRKIQHDPRARERRFASLDAKAKAQAQRNAEWDEILRAQREKAKMDVDK